MNQVRSLPQPPGSNHHGLSKFGATTFALLVGFLLTVCGSLVYYWYFYNHTHITTDNAYIVTTPYQVNSRLMGYVKEVTVEENQVVKKGNVLVALDDSDVKIEMATKQSKFHKAASDVERARRLRSSGAIAQSDLESAEAFLVAAKADYDGSQLKYQFTRILAPTDGVVAKLNVQPGQFVQPGQNLITLVPQEHVWIKANFKETQIQNIKPGQRVVIEVDAYSGVEFEGEVESILPSSAASMSLLQPQDNSGNFTKVTQRFPVRINIHEKKGYKLRPGMSVVPTILVE